EFTGVHPLEADILTVLPTTDAWVTLALDAGPANQFRWYAIFASVTGTIPGTLLPWNYATLPLNWDVFTDFVMAYWNTSFFQNFLGQLDWQGKGSALLYIPNFSLYGFTELDMYFAFTMNNPFNFVSNPIMIRVAE
ncbi:MAG: hypothetical protein KJ645_05860, partial [Planctomycetes bacterium]|nr:hypothetical protein [Planctomycetota bacterium]